jgi:hypothetical protein
MYVLSIQFFREDFNSFREECDCFQEDLFYSDYMLELRIIILQAINICMARKSSHLF